MKKTMYYCCFLLTMIAGSSNLFAQGKPLYTNPIGLQAYTFRGSWPKGIERSLNAFWPASAEHPTLTNTLKT